MQAMEAWADQFGLTDREKVARGHRIDVSSIMTGSGLDRRLRAPYAQGSMLTSANCSGVKPNSLRVCQRAAATEHLQPALLCALRGSGGGRHGRWRA